jgi:hypothetical protein
MEIQESEAKTDGVSVVTAMKTYVREPQICTSSNIQNIA